MCEHSEKKKNLLFWTKLCSLSVWMRVRNLRTKWGMTFCSCWGNKNSELFSEIPVFFFQMFQSRWGAGVFSLVLHCVHAKSLQLCLTLCDPMDSTLPGSCVHLSCLYTGKNTGVGCHFCLQGDLPDPGIQPTSLALAGEFFTSELPGKTLNSLSFSYLFLHMDIGVKLHNYKMKKILLMFLLRSYGM